MRLKMTTLVLSGILLLGALPVRAQKPEDPEARLMKLQAVLHLSAQQTAEIRRILQQPGGPDEMGPPPGEGGGRPPMDGGRPPMGMADREIERLLTPEQSARIKVLLAEAFDREQPPAEPDRDSPPDREGLREARDKTNAAIAGLLTPDQKRLFEILNAGRRGLRRVDSGF